jgi:MFS transporter, DHA1 family, tetracycline resistance protein
VRLITTIILVVIFSHSRYNFSVQKRALSTIFLVVFIDLLGFGIVLPLLPYIAERYQANAFQIGLLAATYSLFQFLSAPILGRLSDRYGRKKLLIVSQIGSVLGYLILGFAHTLPLLFLSRVIDGATGGNISIAQAYIADVTTPKTRAKGMGLIGAAFGLGFAIGPALGGLLYSLGGFSLPAFFAALVGTITVLMTALVLKETVNVSKEIHSERSKFSFRELLVVLTTHPIGLIIFTFFFINFAFSVMQGTFALWAQDRLGYGPSQIGFIFTFIGLGAIVTQLLILPKVVDRFGEKPVFIYGTLLLAMGLLVIPFSRHLSLLLFGNSLLVVGNGLSNSTSQSVASENVNPEEYGGTMGILQSSASLGRIVGPVIGGYLYNLVNPNTPFIIAAAIVFVVFVILKSTLEHEPAFLITLRERWVKI